MSELTDIRQALASALDAALPGFQVSAYILADPTPPSVHVRFSGTQFHQAMSDGLASWNFIVRAYVSLEDDIGGQENLNAVMGVNGSGVKAALEADLTLGGVCQNLIVRTVGNEQEYVAATTGARLLGADWAVEVYL